MKKILLVDDDADIRDSLAAILSQYFEVDTAQDGSEALIQLNQPDLPDLILLDVQMQTPQEGFELASELEKNDELGKIPIIIITSTESITTSEATVDIVRKTREKYSDNTMNVLVIKSLKGNVIVDYQSKKDGKTASIHVAGYHAKPIKPDQLIKEINHLLK